MSRSPLSGLVCVALALFSVALDARAQVPFPEPLPLAREPVIYGSLVEASQRHGSPYAESAAAKRQLVDAQSRAKQNNQRVLIQWGANSCPRSQALAAAMASNASLTQRLLYEYQVVRLDVGGRDANVELARRLGADTAIPCFTVLDGNGKVVTHKSAAEFALRSEAPAYDSNALLAFVTAQQVTPLDAATVLTTAMARAKQEQKLVLVTFGARWCGQCRRFDDWLASPEIATVLAPFLVTAALDIERMRGARAIFEAQLAAVGKGASGVPWFVFLTAEGTLVTHATGPAGNIGFPSRPDQIAHFGSILRATKAGLTEHDITFLMQSLDALRRRAAAKPSAK